jgi:hypothetical protein
VVVGSVVIRKVVSYIRDFEVLLATAAAAALMLVSPGASQTDEPSPPIDVLQQDGVAKAAWKMLW